MHDSPLTTTLLHDAQGVINSVYQSSNGEMPRALIPDQSVGPVVANDHPAAHNPLAYRIVNGAVIERASVIATVSTNLIAANGAEECVIAGLPDPCRVTITGAVSAGPVDVVGGTLALTSTQPGAIKVTVRADPTHKAWETTIHAT